MRQTISALLDEHKAVDVVDIDLAGKTDIADAMIIASGTSNRHVGAIADHILHHLKDIGYHHAHAEGMGDCNWVLIDAGDVIVHIFRPEAREYYNLEKMWQVAVPEHVVELA